MQRRMEKITVALSELWQPSRAGLFCIQGAPRFLCQRGTREALNVTFRDARRFPLGAAGREKRTNDVIADMCFKCQEGFFATELRPER